MAQNRRVLVAKDVNYGSSNASATENTALNPADLANGAIGIYGIHKAGSTNLNQFVLITDGGSEAAGKVPVASFVGDEIFIALGTSKGPLMSNPIQNKVGQHLFSAKAYTAPVKGISTIGYTSGGGLLNFPATVIKGDLLSIIATNKNDPTSGERLPFFSERYSVELLASDTAYTALKKLVNKMYEMDSTTERTLVDPPKIVSNGSGSAAALSATLDAVNGATSMTASAAHGIGVGDWVLIDGDLYQAVTGTTDTTLVVDRPYTGATATIANADFIDAGASVPTQLGVEFTDAVFFENIQITTQGVLEDGTITRVTNPEPGAGSYEEVLNTEKEFRSMLGTSDEITSYIPKEPFKAVEGTTYDTYVIVAQNSGLPTGQQGSVFKAVLYTILYFVVAADTAGKNQSDFEDIMTNAALFGTTFPSIS